MAFSENLQFLRGEAGDTQERLAEKLEVSRQSVSKWESGASFPELDTLLRLCDLYHVSLDLLLRGSAEESRVSDTARYDAFMSRFARRISGAVGGIIAGCGLAALAEAARLPEAWGQGAFLLILSVCVVVIVASGIQHGDFRKKHPAIADFYTDAEKDAFHQRFVWYIAGGVGAILFGILLIAVCFDDGEGTPRESLGVGVLLLLVAGAVTSFIYAGLTEDKYKIWKYNRDNAPSPEARRRLSLIGTVCGSLMLLAAAVYTGLGLALDLWRESVWIFAVAGILCGLASVVLNPYKNEET